MLIAEYFMSRMKVIWHLLRRVVVSPGPFHRRTMPARSDARNNGNLHERSGNHAVDRG